jgi:hypothetical protein
MVRNPNRIDWNRQPLGEMSDHKLAERLGVTRNAVLYARQRRKLPPHHPPASIETKLFRRLVLETFKHTRLPKTMRQIWDDVEAEFGATTERRVYRAIAYWRQRRVLKRLGNSYIKP